MRHRKGNGATARTAEPIPFIRRFRVRTGFRIGTARGYAVPECDEQRWLIGGIATELQRQSDSPSLSGDCTNGRAAYRPDEFARMISRRGYGFFSMIPLITLMFASRDRIRSSNSFM